MENQPGYLIMNPVYKWFYKVPLKLEYNYRPYLDFNNEIKWERKLVLNPIKVYTKINDCSDNMFCYWILENGKNKLN